jgi:proline iminopeptidase
LSGRRVSIGDLSLFVEERGTGYPLIVLHGGPGLDHHQFADYLDPLTDTFKLVLVDQRSHGLSDRTPPETWTLAQFAEDVVSLAEALGFERYGVLGHSWGAFVALQNAVDFPGAASQTIISAGLPSSRYLEKTFQAIGAFEPIELRKQVMSSWEREKDVQTEEEMAQLLRDQMPFHFADPRDPRIDDMMERSARARYAPEVVRFFSENEDYGALELEERLIEIGHPVLIISGRHERTCVVEGAEALAAGIPHSQLVILENSAHMSFVEQNDAYCRAVREFLTAHMVVV